MIDTTALHSKDVSTAAGSLVGDRGRLPTPRRWDDGAGGCGSAKATGEKTASRRRRLHGARAERHATLQAVKSNVGRFGLPENGSRRATSDSGCTDLSGMHRLGLRTNNVDG